MKKIGNLLFLFLMIFSQGVGADQVTFEATVDRESMTIEDTLTLRLTVQSSGNVAKDAPQLPPLKEWDVLNTWSSVMNKSTFTNGKFEYTKSHTFNYMMSPTKKGDLTIAPATLVVGGQTLKTKPIVITVTGAAQRQAQRGRQGAPKVPSTVDEAIQADEDLMSQLLRRRGKLPQRGGTRTLPRNNREAFFVTVEVDKNEAYVGEQINANWYLYTRGNVQNFDAIKYPQLRGFWKEDLFIANRLDFQKEIVNGIAYNKALLVSYALFPISKGKKYIDSYKAKATVIDLNSGMGFFGLGKPRTYVKISKKIPINVKPLPKDGQPPSFSGAVGQFTITGSLSSEKVQVNKPVTLSIRFQGQGNVKAIELPPLNLPDNLEVYDTKKDSKFLKSGKSYQEFEILLIPRAQGEMVIKPITLSYFDPQKKRYVSSQTPEFKIQVLPGDGSQNYASSPMAQAPAGPKLSAQDIRYLKGSATRNFSPFTKAVGWLVIFILIWGWFGYQYWAILRDPEVVAANLRRQRIQAKLKVARKKLKAQDHRGVGVECSNAVLQTLGDVTGEGGASLAADRLLGKLPQLDETFKNQTMDFLSRCEIVSFAPEAIKGQESRDSSKLIGEAEKIITHLYKLDTTAKS